MAKKNIPINMDALQSSSASSSTELESFLKSSKNDADRLVKIIKDNDAKLNDREEKIQDKNFKEVEVIPTPTTDNSNSSNFFSLLNELDETFTTCRIKKSHFKKLDELKAALGYKISNPKLVDIGVKIIIEKLENERNNRN